MLKIIFLGLALHLGITHAKTDIPYWRAFEAFPDKYNDGKLLIHAWANSLSNMVLEQEVEEARFQLLQGALEMELSTLFYQLPIPEKTPEQIKWRAPKEGERGIVVTARVASGKSIMSLGKNYQTSAWNKIGEFDIIGKLTKKIKNNNEDYFFNAYIKANNGPYPADCWRIFFNNLAQDYYQDEFSGEMPESLAKSFPRLTQHSRQFLTVKGQQQKIDYGKYQSLHVQINMDELRKKYFHSYQYLKRLQSAFKLKLVIENPPYGDHLFSYDSETKEFNIDTYFGEEQVLKSKWPDKLNAYIDLMIVLHGVKIKIDQWPLLIKFKKDTFAYEWYSKSRPRKIEIESNLLMRIPISMAKNVLNLEEEIGHFFDVISSSKARKEFPNLQIELARPMLESQNSAFVATMTVPFKYSYLIQLGLGMLGHRLNPSSELILEWENWRRELFKLLLLDFSQNEATLKKML